MENILSNKTVIISGGASGIGLALAEEFGKQQMNIVIADIEKKQLEAAKLTLTQQNIPVLTCVLDVTIPQQWQQVIEATKAKFGNIHMLVNNAGVGGMPGTIEDTNHDTWKWVMDVNLMGVVYGTEAVTPHLKEHSQGGWIINVASMAGMVGVPFAGAYTASKAAVVAMTESWAAELAPHNIKVSALCPAFVKTKIHQSHRNRQEKYNTTPLNLPTGKDAKGMMKAAEMVESGIEPQILARRVVEALHSNQTYIFTHPNYRPVTEARAQAIDNSFIDAENSQHVAHLIHQEIAVLK